MYANPDVVHELEVFYAKGPVGVETANMRWRQAARVVRYLFTVQEWDALMTARSHGLLGEGREEWDGLCGRHRERMGLLTPEDIKRALKQGIKDMRAVDHEIRSPGRAPQGRFR